MLRWECEDGAEAVELYQQYRPDWVLMDIQLKAVDGLTATRMILNFDPSAKVIMVTQYDDPEYQDQAREIGVYGYILKDNLIQIPKIIQANKVKIILVKIIWIKIIWVKIILVKIIKDKK